MPHSKYLKGHVTYYSIALLYFVEKSKRERNIVRSKIAIQTMLLTRFFNFYAEKIYINSRPLLPFSSRLHILTVSTDYLAKRVHVQSRNIIVYLWSLCNYKYHLMAITTQNTKPDSDIQRTFGWVLGPEN